MAGMFNKLSDEPEQVVKYKTDPLKKIYFVSSQLMIE